MPPSKNIEALYDLVITEVFKRLRKSSARATQLDFNKTLVEDVIKDLESKKVLPSLIKNIPDIKYTYDARKDFPKSISTNGHWAIIGRGKSLYSFVRISHNNLIRIPNDLPYNPAPTNLKDNTPISVSKVIGNDEQAMLRRIFYNNIIGQCCQLTVYLVQSHERTTVSSGQIEVDEVYVGEDSDKTNFVIPISAKGGGKDCLSYTQVLNLNLYCSEKEKYRTFKSRPFGISRGPDGSIYLLEFSTNLDVQSIKIVRVARYLLA